ncbi:MAG: hypothetical protein AAGG44_12170, partial [Planctomycetota bacterium]
SDHPSRTLGIARAYVKVDLPFTYTGWIEGIRRGRTFTSSGPLVSLSVNDALIGATISTGADDLLKISASFVSRDPIGTAQLVSNGAVIAERTTSSTRCDLTVTIPAEESRWIIARSSHRSDGRADFGFGNFNAITGPGVAHTSPIYVEVDGRPRFEPAAAEFWRERIAKHIRDVQTVGRFAHRGQMQEAVDYLALGADMYSQLPDQIESARSRMESLPQSISRLANVLRRFNSTDVTRTVLRRLPNVQTRNELIKTLKPLVALRVSVNPESRVKVDALQPMLQLHQGRPQRFLIEVENTAGVTAPLNLTAIDVTLNPPSGADWCRIKVVDSPFTSRFFTGAEMELKVLEITPLAAGLREVRIVGDAGQGTQDLGFRASADVLLNISAKGRHADAQ